jgi:hypothetical protein
VPDKGRGEGVMGQGNCRYDQQGYDVHLAGDRSANDPRALDYPLDTQADAAWPGPASSWWARSWS